MDFLLETDLENESFFFESIENIREGESQTLSNVAPLQLNDVVTGCASREEDFKGEDPDDVWAGKGLEIMKFKTRCGKPQHLRGWIEIARNMNQCLRPSYYQQFTAKAVLLKYREMTKKLSHKGSLFDSIEDISVEPLVRYPGESVTVDLKFWNSNVSCGNLGGKLKLARNSFSNWYQKLYDKYKEFWLNKANEKLFIKLMESGNQRGSFYMSHITAQVNAYAAFTNNIRAVEYNEIMRKLWEFNAMSSKLLRKILADSESDMKHFYSGVVGRDLKTRQQEHENLHGKCEWLDEETSNVKQRILHDEIINISVLNAMMDFKLIASCLNSSDGGDGRTALDNYVSSCYTCYTYSTRSPNSNSSSRSGFLAMIKEYKKMPIAFDNDQQRIIYWFCALCYRWIRPQDMSSHSALHLRENVSCSDANCSRTFTSVEMMEYHAKMSHIMVRCAVNHSDRDGNKEMNLYNFRNHHLKKYHQKEVEKWNRV